MKLTSIFDCKEYTAGRMPPFQDTWRNGRHNPTLFCFARTPTGRVSKFWCSLTFWTGKIPEKRAAEWLAGERPKLRKGYAWSEPYLYP